MNYFEHQARARRRTTLLVVYFLCAVAAVTAAVNLLIWLALLILPSVTPPDLTRWFTGSGGLWTTLATLAVIATGTLRRAWQLRQGGEGLARLLGATPVSNTATDPAQRRLINVVEEMAIAAGTPRPRLYILEHEDGINAFVAGLQPARTVLVVTRGTVEQLDRDELQGVVAHEFSHILNADMRLNLRLMAALAGLLAVGQTGEFLLHHGSERSLARVPVLVAVGALLMAIGYAGLFAGRLIKAAISRQRERLADASALQFTRQPHGLAGALIKIRNGQGSHLHHRHAEDLSHMAFAETLSVRLRILLGTHPPLDERLRNLGREWPARARVRSRSEQATSRQVGHLDAANLGYVHSLLESIPAPVHQALATEEGAECVLYALALGQQPAPSALRAGRRAALVDQVRGLGTRLRLPLLDLALATLRDAPARRRPVILRQLKAITGNRRADDVLCWVMGALAETALSTARRPLPRPDIHRLGAVAGEIQLLFSALAWAGDSARASAVAAFRRATHGLLPGGRLLLTPDRCTAQRLDQAVARLNRLSPVLKAPLVDAAADLVLADRKVEVAEAELLRALCALLECPMPPLFSTDRGANHRAGRATESGPHRDTPAPADVRVGKNPPPPPGRPVPPTSEGNK